MWNVWKVETDKNGRDTYELLVGFDKRPLRFDSKTKAEYFVETFREDDKPVRLVITEDNQKL